MSDRLKCVSGIILILFSLFASLSNAVYPRSQREIKCVAGKVPVGQITAIDPDQKEGKIRINIEGVDMLIKLQGIGDTLARAIIAERMENGPFYYSEDLESVKGIGIRTVERIKDQIDLTQGESGE